MSNTKVNQAVEVKHVEVNNSNSKTFRYKLSDDILSIITQFSKIHQLDDRHTYKENWLIWLNTNNEMVEQEVRRLKQSGYTGDVIDKMFKAGRYYFREKVIVEKMIKKEKKEENEDEDKPRRDYITMDQTVIKAMDAHLKTIINQPNFKPAKGYDDFCQKNIEILRTEIIRLTQENKNITSEMMSCKIKKTYKNRYFNFVRSN